MATIQKCVTAYGKLSRSRQRLQLFSCTSGYQDLKTDLPIKVARFPMNECNLYICGSREVYGPFEAYRAWLQSVPLHALPLPGSSLATIFRRYIRLASALERLLWVKYLVRKLAGEWNNVKKQTLQGQHESLEAGAGKKSRRNMVCISFAILWGPA